MGGENRNRLRGEVLKAELGRTLNRASSYRWMFVSLYWWDIPLNCSFSLCLSHCYHSLHLLLLLLLLGSLPSSIPTMCWSAVVVNVGVGASCILCSTKGRAGGYTVSELQLNSLFSFKNHAFSFSRIFSSLTATSTFTPLGRHLNFCSRNKKEQQIFL